MDLLQLAKTATCRHAEAQHALTGTWCTPQYKEAIRLGYWIVHLHEIWHFGASRTGLSRDDANTWLKLKEEVSGWPAECTTADQRAAHVAAYQA